MSNILKLEDKNNDITKRLLDIWEASVRATHDFLSESDILELKPLVLKTLNEHNNIYYYEKSNNALGFIGISQQNIDMLFIDSEFRSSGIGKTLVTFAITELGVTTVDVNEQNHQAAGFYNHLGFELISRSPIDDQGRPFPILHLQLLNE